MKTKEQTYAMLRDLLKTGKLYIPAPAVDWKRELELAECFAEFDHVLREYDTSTFDPRRRRTHDQTEDRG